MKAALLPPALLLLAGCEFPDVPRSARPEIRWEQFAEGEERRAALEAEPHTMEGLLVGNAVSSVVIEGSEGGFTTLQIGPSTRLYIGDVPAGLREIQPGSRVRVSLETLPGGRSQLATEIRAEPKTNSIGSEGWREP